MPVLDGVVASVVYVSVEVDGDDVDWLMVVGGWRWLVYGC